MKIVLYYSKKEINNIIEVNEHNIIDEIYLNLAMIPTLEQLKQYPKLKDIISEKSDEKILEYISGSRDYISRLEYKLPLFDYSSKNIYLIDKEDIYTKVTFDNLRFPSNNIIELLKKTLNDIENLKESKPDWAIKYIKKINKNLNFLTNYNLTILKDTYIKVYLNTNPNSRELTTCIKPSYLPYQYYQSPYYTKSELISMALNLNLIKDLKIKPWSYDDTQLKKICNKLSKYEISTKMLIYNQLYILYNNAKSYVQFYSLYGSYYFNTYLRNKSISDPDLDNHIDNLLKIVKNSPEFDSEYEVYRFIETDDYLNHLKIGDTFEERSFISTTRNPFYSMKNNLFGFILIKIRLKKNLPGIALLIESYSNYPHEQEVLLSPSKLKLVEISSDLKYYHWNKLAEKKIIKKYIFEYVEPISYDIKYYTSNYIKIKDPIPLIDFYKITYNGSNTTERTLNFFNSLPKLNIRRVFKSIIGNKEYIFSAYFLVQNKVYSKFFFLQKENEQNKLLGDEIYLIVQDPSNGEINLIIEIRNIISVNYYHRYSGVSCQISDNDLINWLSGLSKALEISTVIIHGNYSSYAQIVENIVSKSGIQKDILLKDFETIQNIDNPDANILNLYTADINTYCTDLIDYIFLGIKRFANKLYIDRKVPFHMIDRLHKLKFKDLFKVDMIEYNSLDKIYSKLEDQPSLFDFYKLIHNSYPYLIPKLQNLILMSYPKNCILPWHFYYILNPYEYLFEQGIIQFIPSSNSDKIDELIKNLELEVKFIQENKFRQIMR